MKLNDALRKLCLEHGNIIVQKKNLVYLLSDMGAFEELPRICTRQASGRTVIFTWRMPRM